MCFMRQVSGSLDTLSGVSMAQVDFIGGKAIGGFARNCRADARKPYEHAAEVAVVQEHEAVLEEQERDEDEPRVLDCELKGAS